MFLAGSSLPLTGPKYWLRYWAVAALAPIQDSPVLPDHEGGSALGERSLDVPGFQQGSFGVDVGVDEAGQDDAAWFQVDDLAVGGGGADRVGVGADPCDERAFDEEVGADGCGADAVGDEAAAEQGSAGHRLISHPSRLARACSAYSQKSTCGRADRPSCQGAGPRRSATSCWAWQKAARHSGGRLHLH